MIVTKEEVDTMFARIEHRLDNQGRKHARKVIRLTLESIKDAKEQYDQDD